MILSKSFYSQDTVTVAKELLGCFLVHEIDGVRLVGRIVETEAYLKDDPASHGFKWQTKKTEAMFGPPGHAYIYFTYGMYYCFNVVTADEGVAEAVLIRAVEPVEGVDIMQKNRGLDSLKNLTNGPAKLVLAMQIPATYNKIPLEKPPLYIMSADSFGKVENFAIITTTRIGISKAADAPFRFYLKDNPFVSKK